MSRESDRNRRTPRVRFDRNELAGAFGDIGTDFPLLTGLILVADLDATSVLVLFGVMQLSTGLLYGMPMPAQPLKAMAALVIAQGLSADVLYGGGLAIGVVMLLLTVTGLIDRIARAVPRTVVRGIQFGLGLQLALLALREYVPADGGVGFVMAAIAALVVLMLAGSRRYPAALLVIGLGFVYALIFRIDLHSLTGGIGVMFPEARIPAIDAIATGAVVLALPQLPLSLGNSILATHQLTTDFFPDRAPALRKIGLTYSVMNLVNPFFGGVPTCHGSGGIAGHHYFGARTGGSVVVYGSMYLVLGLFAGGAFEQVVQLFPLPVLGVILAFEGLALMRLLRDTAGDKGHLAIALLVGLIAAGLPYGYVIGVLAGAALMRLPRLTAGFRL